MCSRGTDRQRLLRHRHAGYARGLWERASISGPWKGAPAPDTVRLAPEALPKRHPRPFPPAVAHERAGGDQPSHQAHGLRLSEHGQHLPIPADTGLLNRARMRACSYVRRRFVPHSTKPYRELCGPDSSACMASLRLSGRKSLRPLAPRPIRWERHRSPPHTALHRRVPACGRT